MEAMMIGKDTKIKKRLEKDFSWALGHKNLHRMRTTELAKKADMSLLRLLTVFLEHFTLTRKIYYSRGEFFHAEQRQNETPKKHLKKMQIEERLRCSEQFTARINGFKI